MNSATDWQLEFVAQFTNWITDFAWSPNGATIGVKVQSIGREVNMHFLDIKTREIRVRPVGEGYGEPRFNQAGDKVILRHSTGVSIRDLDKWRIISRVEDIRPFCNLGSKTDIRVWNEDAELWVTCQRETSDDHFPIAAVFTFPDLHYMGVVTLTPPPKHMAVGRTLPQDVRFLKQGGELVVSFTLYTQYPLSGDNALRSPTERLVGYVTARVNSQDAQYRSMSMLSLDSAMTSGTAWSVPTSNRIVLARRYMERYPPPPADAPNKLLEVREFSTGNIIREFYSLADEKIGGQLNSFDLAPRSQLLVAAVGQGRDFGGLKLWNIMDGSLVAEIPGTSGWAPRFSEDEKYIAVSSGKQLLVYSKKNRN